MGGSVASRAYFFGFCVLPIVLWFSARATRPRGIPFGPDVVAAVHRYVESRVERAGGDPPTRPALRPSLPERRRALQSAPHGPPRRRLVLPGRFQPLRRLAHAPGATPTPPSSSTPEPPAPKSNASWATATCRPPRVYLKVAGRESKKRPSSTRLGGRFGDRRGRTESIGAAGEGPTPTANRSPSGPADQATFSAGRLGGQPPGPIMGHQPAEWLQRIPPVPGGPTKEVTWATRTR